MFNVPRVGPDRLPKLQPFSLHIILAPLFSIRDNYKYKDTYRMDDEEKTKVFFLIKSGH